MDELATAAPMDELTARFYTVSPYEGFDPSLHPDDLQGWNSADPLFDEVIKKLSPRIIVEAGSWKGTSAIHVRRDKAALLQRVQDPPGNRSSRKQPEQAWR